jgi:hypothetical protein
MAAPRLNDSQKQELVARYRQGETAQTLAAAYGCSPNTVSRVLKAAIDPEEMAALKKQSRSRVSAAPELPVAAPEPPSATEAEPEIAAAPAAGMREWAIGDADDFAADPALDDGDTDADADDDADAADAAATLEPVALLEAQPLEPGMLPSCVYLLVDKTVELQARPLCEFPDLGSLPDDEQSRQALMLYTNPRQAKRQCGRSQRVIKVPDAEVLQRRSSYLVAQGITRLVLEGGSLFSIPGC